jgi:hypothetical protein
MNTNKQHSVFVQSHKAPKELKQKTFKKIDRLNTLFELGGFFTHIPRLLLDGSKDSSHKK